MHTQICECFSALKKSALYIFTLDMSVLAIDKQKKRQRSLGSVRHPIYKKKGKFWI